MENLSSLADQIAELADRLAVLNAQIATSLEDQPRHKNLILEKVRGCNAMARKTAMACLESILYACPSLVEEKVKIVVEKAHQRVCEARSVGKLVFDLSLSFKRYSEGGHAPERVLDAIVYYWFAWEAMYVWAKQESTKTSEIVKAMESMIMPFIRISSSFSELCGRITEGKARSSKAAETRKEGKHGTANRAERIYEKAIQDSEQRGDDCFLMKKQFRIMVEDVLHYENEEASEPTLSKYKKEVERLIQEKSGNKFAKLKILNK